MPSMVISPSSISYSSDSSSFAGNGVPAVTFARLQSRGGAEIHSRHDIIDHLDPQKFIETVEFMAKFSENVINSKVFPVSRELPKEINEKLEKYKKMMMASKKKEEPKEESLPKQTDRAESSKNGVRRKKLYIAFIEWCKEYNNRGEIKWDFLMKLED